MIGFAAGQTASEYEHEYRCTEYEYEEIRCDVRTTRIDRMREGNVTHVKTARSKTLVQ
jgi:hypothetical protein